MIVVRRAAKSDARVLSELATETYADAFGHSFSARDLTAEMRANLMEACFERYIVGARRFDVASGAATDPDLIMVRRSSSSPD
jgi:hypothetical protein